jgi:small subunit ribosomal protein S13
MVRIMGVDLPKNKCGFVGLTHIYGIGLSTAKKILNDINIKYYVKVKYWSDKDINNIRQYILNKSIKVEGELRSEKQTNIKRLIDIGCYRGIRHRQGLPVRGQKTKNNCRTRKGRRKTVANKKKVTK